MRPRAGLGGFAILVRVSGPETMSPAKMRWPGSKKFVQRTAAKSAPWSARMSAAGPSCPVWATLWRNGFLPASSTGGDCGSTRSRISLAKPSLSLGMRNSARESGEPSVTKSVIFQIRLSLPNAEMTLSCGSRYLVRSNTSFPAFVRPASYPLWLIKCLLQQMRLLANARHKP